MPPPVPAIRIPPQLSEAVKEDNCAERRAWLAVLPARIEAVAEEWELELGDPYLPGGQCAWVAPAVGPAGEALALKVSWRHREAEHEAEALRFWDGEGAIRCHAARTRGDTAALLLERCVPGAQLSARPEAEQDLMLAGLLPRLWARPLADGHPFESLEAICDAWADDFEAELDSCGPGVDPGLARDGMRIFRELPLSAERRVLLATDLHAGNVLAAEREPWLVIDPKPFVGDPAFDAVQHMLNCDERLATDPLGLASRMAELLEVDPERVRLWLFARAVQESLYSPAMRELARRIAPRRAGCERTPRAKPRLVAQRACG